MTENWNYLREQPYPLPLPGASLADQGASLWEGAPSAPPALPPAKQPSPSPFVLPEDDYQWMILL